MNDQVVDPAVSRAKFERELEQFRRLEAMHRQRGWWLMSAEFPIVQIAFFVPNVRPATVAVCARFDFTNYDLWPPSVTFVDFHTGKPLTHEEVGLQFHRALPDGTVAAMLQGHPGKPAFLCLPGVREYHEHPAHTGDSWLLHRGRGEGGLLFLVDKISTYGSEPAVLQVQMRVGLQQGYAPL
ncbi:hypothetical protein LRS10_23640 [Phenylobacterium sp. J426]|uniref:putative metal-binding protein n=1 Tax=Phenylobacterium sp. J426 TaxID=2898439 RepID=UPI0021512A6D|nr:putative metal-binding protein [Phenylobacterium sp. J426]MCR5876885.1 hypothetical protein [Phenylobacterium sp. J426]